MLVDVFNILKHAIMVTGFVLIMMLIIEYINVQTKGIWQHNLLRNRWKQYLMAAFLGAIPGCLGAFTAVALFSHRMISFGAIVAAMIATSGDEAFVMFAMFPQKAAILTILILVIGIIAGYITDRIYTPDKILEKIKEKGFPIHDEPQCNCFQKEKFFQQLIKPSIYRLFLIIILLSLFVVIFTGEKAGDLEHWIKYTVLFALGLSLFIVISVPEHFLKEHLWEHILKMHIPKIFLWTLGTLLILSFLMNYINIQAWLTDNILLVLIVAVLVGIIPESGPHMVFVTLFAQGAIPFSVLLASSIAQDGHGMLPLIAESKRGFIAVKGTNIIVALIIGITSYLLGF